MKDARLGFLLDRELAEKINELAQADERTPNNYIRLVIMKAVREDLKHESDR